MNSMYDVKEIKRRNVWWVKTFLDIRKFKYEIVSGSVAKTDKYYFSLLPVVYTLRDGTCTLRYREIGNAIWKETDIYSFLKLHNCLWKRGKKVLIIFKHDYDSSIPNPYKTEVIGFREWTGDYMTLIPMYKFQYAKVMYKGDDGEMYPKFTHKVIDEIPPLEQSEDKDGTLIQYIKQI